MILKPVPPPSLSHLTIGLDFPNTVEASVPLAEIPIPSAKKANAKKSILKRPTKKNAPTKTPRKKESPVKTKPTAVQVDC